MASIVADSHIRSRSRPLQAAGPIVAVPIVVVPTVPTGLVADLKDPIGVRVRMGPG